ncbi:hypothetical protein ME1_00282 [Bartonella vinsonii subsp. arupensis OK-94-513]|uniref:Sensor N-terminal transmembrane domain-containing protein n=1 Tax=Bartonella vinsonii subsp. arupensis OK-94-513 TaxID=1094562 RepID=J1JWY3_BARVI|nr:hypothetical protein ME1_00282 [Bartonella vinsonii subsp. arupensis OK-94-513]
MKKNTQLETLQKTISSGIPSALFSLFSYSHFRIRRLLGQLLFSSLTRRIVILNIAALGVLVTGILYFNQFRDGLIEATIKSLSIQGKIIAGAIAASATVDPNSILIDPQKLLELHAGESVTPAPQSTDSWDFPINPEQVAPFYDASLNLKQQEHVSMIVMLLYFLIRAFFILVVKFLAMIYLHLKRNKIYGNISLHGFQMHFMAVVLHLIKSNQKTVIWSIQKYTKH